MTYYNIIIIGKNIGNHSIAATFFFRRLRFYPIILQLPKRFTQLDFHSFVARQNTYEFADLSFRSIASCLEPKVKFPRKKP